MYLKIRKYYEFTCFEFDDHTSSKQSEFKYLWFYGTIYEFMICPISINDITKAIAI